MRLGEDIARRLLDLALQAVRISAALPAHPVGRHVSLQLVKAATAAGANYEEARAAESRDDFIHKCGIAAKEARETSFWLAIVDRAGWIDSKQEPIMDESQQLAAILHASARTARSRADSG